jgi:hypothetical protein
MAWHGMVYEGSTLTFLCVLSRDKGKDIGGSAVREKDETSSKAKAKEEFPEAPVTIGMEEERGGKGM